MPRKLPWLVRLSPVPARLSGMDSISFVHARPQVVRDEEIIILRQDQPHQKKQFHTVSERDQISSHLTPLRQQLVRQTRWMLPMYEMIAGHQ